RRHGGAVGGVGCGAAHGGRLLLPNRRLGGESRVSGLVPAWRGAQSDRMVGARREGGHVIKRHMLVVSHTGRPESLDAAATVCRMLIADDVVPVVPLEDVKAVTSHDGELAIETLHEGEASDGVGL